MKTDLETLKDTFQVGYDAYYDSRMEAQHIWDLYHNRQWTPDQQHILEERGQPKETFNVIKLFGRMLIGYYSTVLNNVRAEPTKASDATIASLLTDTIHSVFESNNLEVEGDKIKLSAIIAGVMCAQVEPHKTGERDEFGRPVYAIKVRQVADYEIVLDPMSTAEDYSDAQYLHRFKWLPKESVIKAFGKAKQEKLDSYYNHLNIEEAEFEYSHGQQFQGRYKVFDNYLIVHTVIDDDDGKRWSIFWCGDVELRRTEITYKEVKWPYRVTKLHTSDKNEYYGIFREVAETQKAINQAVVKLQLMVNTQKVFVEANAVEDMNTFTSMVNRVNGVIPVKDLKGIKVEELSREAISQYEIIDRAFNRIQRILSINDSFLGMAFASDSGRKVKLQQNATIMALRYLTVRIEAFYQALGMDVAMLIKQYYTAHQALRVTDELVGARFIELNQPMQVWTGEFDQANEPIYQPVFEPVLNPETGDQEVNDEGQLIFAPIAESGTEFDFDKVDIKVRSVAFNDEDERAQLMVETVMSGNIGQMLAQINPAGFFKAAGLTLRTMKTKYSPEISRILEETGAMLSENPEAAQQAMMMASGLSGRSGQQQAQSRELKLPTNTNESDEVM